MKPSASFPIIYFLLIVLLSSCNKTIYPIQSLEEANKDTRRLDLSERNLTQLPTQITSFKKLTFINLSDNPQLDWQDAKNKLPSLKRIEEVVLDKNAGANWQKILQVLASFKRLKQIHLSDNNFKILPKEITLINKVKYLNLAGNPLEKGFEKQLGSFTQLETLLLSDCQLQQFPDELTQLKNLVTLDLMYNDLKELPPSFSNFSKLLSLNISNNQFETYPKALLGLQQKIVLLCKENQIEEVPEAVKSNKFLIFDLTDNLLPDETKEKLKEWVQADILVLD